MSTRKFALTIHSTCGVGIRYLDRQGIQYPPPLHEIHHSNEPFANYVRSHWDWLLKDITGGEVVDEHGPLKHSGYGLEDAYHKLDKQYALLNADSYVLPHIL